MTNVSLRIGDPTPLPQGEVRPAAMMISAGLADPRMKIEIEVTALRS